MPTSLPMSNLSPVRREFTMARELLSTVIRAQAGSLEKGLLEGVMNSIDAGAKTVRLNLTPTTVTLTDDGRGIQTEEELIKHFECFGTRHVEGDARFGRFRIGRAQLFCFGKNTWKTTKFKMTVDIGSGEDYSYQLEGLLNKVKGCEILIELYKPLTLPEMAATSDELIKYLTLMPAKIFLNGKRINKAPEERTDWTAEDELAYYRVYASSDDATGVMLYNNGAFVREMSRKEWGVHAVVCSKVPLTLNSARTEVIYADCPYTAVIQERLRLLVAKELANSKRKLSQTDRNFVARMIAESVKYDKASTLPQGLTKLKVLKDVHDRLISFEDLFKAKCVAPFDWGLETESLAVNRTGRAIVLSGDTSDLLEAWGQNGVLGRLLEGLKRSGLVGEDAQVPEAKYVKDLRKGLNGDSVTIPDSKVPVSSKVLWSMMKSLRDINEDIAQALTLSKSCGGPRHLHFGDSAANLAWTDGKSYIGISRKYLLTCAQMGFGGMMQMVALLIHEYCHDDLDSESHHHDTLFYSTFHDLMVHHGATWGDLAMRAYVAFGRHLHGLQPATEANKDQALTLYVKKLLGSTKGMNQELKLQDASDGNESGDETALTASSNTGHVAVAALQASLI